MSESVLRKVEVLLIVEADIATTQLLEQILKSLQSHGLYYRKRLLAELQLADFSGSELPLVVRSGDPLLAYWLKLWAAADISFVYYLDDNFWRIEGDSELAKYYRLPIIRRTLEMAVAQAHQVITNSEVLANFLRGWSNRVKVLPSPFSFELIEGLKSYAGEELRIGFAGSPSRVKDLDIVAPILTPLLQRYEKVVVEFVGVLPKGIHPGQRIRFFPHCASYEDYIRFQVERGWAIGWAPLFDTEANRSKTNNKYREYAACCIAGIYTDIPPYTGSVQPDVSGILVQNAPEAWLSATERLVRDEHLRKKIANAAYDDVRKHHALQVVAGDWLLALQESRNNAIFMGRMVRSRRLAFVAWWLRICVQVSLSYQEGGVWLVAKRSILRISRAALTSLR
ncbi:glycosyltransferase family protein [Vibrio fluvialis]|uniref:glycosyltransferase family protein n=1 Tax=Vibrio fluvialis TaxID=676 RepID=UPI00301C7588